MSIVVPLVTSYDPLEAFDAQLIGIQNVIDAAVEAGVGHFVLFFREQRQSGAQP